MSDSESRLPGRPATFTFPPDNEVLAERVREIFHRHGPETTEAAVVVVRDRLARIYPTVAVWVREDLAGFGQPALYIFRDGSATSRFGGEEWVQDPATARVTADSSGIYMDANDAATALFGRGRDAIVGRRAGAFTRPDARVEDVEELWRRLEKTGKLHSLALINLPDGTERRVEFVTTRTSDSIVTSLRAITGETFD